MRAVLLGALVLLAACSSAEETLLSACRVHDSALRAIAPQMAAQRLTQSQVDAVFASERTSLAICNGTVTDYTTALIVLEGEALRLAIMQSTATEE